MARAWGGTAEEKAHFEFNARNVLTLWGPNGEIAGQSSYIRIRFPPPNHPPTQDGCLHPTSPHPPSEV